MSQKALESRVEKLEQRRGNGVRYLVVADPPTPEQEAQIAAWRAEDLEVVGIRDPYSRTVTVRTGLPRGPEGGDLP